MGSRELEDRQERQHLEWVASQLGITPEELADQNWSSDQDVSDDGDIYGYNVPFGEGSNPEVLAKIGGLQGRPLGLRRLPAQGLRIMPRSLYGAADHYAQCPLSTQSRL
jgi:hypothetical protein